MGTSPAASAVAPAAASIAGMRLHDWSAPAPIAGRPERDIFAFKRRASKPSAPPAPPAGLFADATQPPLALFKLIGFADETGPDGQVRTAIISGQGHLYLVKEGETVAWIYRVGTISADAVELIDTTGGAALRLALK